MKTYDFKPITNFYFQVGKSKTDVPWFRPDPEYLNRWKDEFFSIEEASRYRYFFHGGARHDPGTTWDVDIAICGTTEEKDYPLLEYIMYMMRQIGFKNRQLIEPFWQDVPAEIYLRPVCDHYQIACETYMKSGRCTLKQCMETPAYHFTTKKRIRYGQFLAKNEFEQRVPDPIDGKEVETIQSGELIITNIIEPNRSWSNKIYQKMKTGYYKKSPIEINRETNFRNFLPWP